MKIAIVAFHLNIPGGSQRQALSLAVELQKMGDKVVFYTTELNKEHFPDLLAQLDIRVVKGISEEEKSIPGTGLWSTVKKKLRRDELYIDLARRIAAAMDPDIDVINGHDYDAYRVGYFYKRRNPKSKNVWMMNEIPFSYLPKNTRTGEVLRKLYNVFKKIADRNYFASIDKVTTLNPFDAEWAQRNFGLSTTVVASGCDGERFYGPAKTASHDPALLVCVGIFAPYRKFEDAICAVGILKKHGRHVRLLIRGTAGSADNPYTIFLKEVAAREDVTELVEFDFGIISEDALKKVYAAADIFIFPTYIGFPRYGYGWGLAAFEAMAAGTPVILCNTTASTRLLTEGKNALMVDPMRPDQIASRVQMLLDDHQLYTSLSTNAQQFVLQEVTWAAYAAAMRKAWDQTG